MRADKQEDVMPDLRQLQSPAPLRVIPCRDGDEGRVQYIMGLALLARYWTRKDWEQLEWILFVFRGELPIGALRKQKCDRCGKEVAKIHQMQEVQLCGICIMEFINSKTVTTKVEA